MKNPNTEEGLRSNPVLHMPQQAPPIDRSSGRTAGAVDGTSGVEPSYFPWLDDLLKPHTPYLPPVPPAPPWLDVLG
ncbi:hypothetical protein [Streptomyces sp. NBC_00105]|uniref:hypothetical protein n=1 Tax=Streptomyces sp. NBC_00105 TaxID=2903622 RepID=UPI00324E9436